jgi:hypothetical protein
MSQPKQEQATAQDPTATPAKTELADAELDQVSGGIIIIGGVTRQAFEPNLAVQSFSFGAGN